MKSFLTIAALAASMLGAANAQIDPTACTAQNSVTYTYNLGTSCYKTTIDHSTTNGAQNVVIDVNFPTNGPSGQLSASTLSSTTSYAVFVWDQTQGADTAKPFVFGPGNTPAIKPINDEVNSAGSVNLQGTTLQTKQSSGSFAQSTGTYVYSGSVTAPAGRWQLTFQTQNSQGTGKSLSYFVAIMPVDASKGHLASSSMYPINYGFGAAGSAGWVPLIGFPSGSTVYTAITSGYAPAMTGVLVQDIAVAAVPGTGSTIDASLWKSGQTNQQPLYSETVNNARVGHFDFPFVATPPDWSGKTAGVMTVAWTLTYIDTTSTSTTAGLDATVAPGPFAKITPGSTDEKYTDAMVLSSGSTLSIMFDGSNAGSTSAPRATKSRQLVRVPIPDNWWAMRFKITAEATSGSSVPTGTPAQAAGFAGGITYADYTSVPVSGFAVATALPQDVNNLAAYWIANSGVNSNTAQPDRPFSFISTASAPYIAGSGPSDSNNGFNNPNFPLYDNRLSRGGYVYIKVCRRNGCSSAPYTSGVTTSTVSLSWAETMEIQGECSSNADCVSSRPGGHPSQARASHFSANGDVNRFASCMLLPSGSNPNLPESKCVECMSDCDCMAGQFCNVLSGVAAIGSAGVFTTFDELTRLRSGICMKKDLNGTQFGKQCHQGWNQPAGGSVSIRSAITATGQVPYMMGQDGAVPCGDSLWVNSSYTLQSTAYNTTNLTAVTIWSGFCDQNNICRECARSVASSGASTQCSGGQVCLDGMYHPTVSVDQTIRTFNNDTRAGTLLAIVCMFLVLLIGMAVQCYMSRRTGGAATSSTTNPIAKSMDEARA